MNVKVKPSQLTRVGYEYQDLCGLQLIVDWLDEPTKFEWVKFDNAVLDGKKVKGLDDIIALRADGKYILKQVKFTIDPSREDLKLSLDWLTQPSGSKGTGKSLIEKWSSAFFAVPKDEIAEAELQTNRIPDSSLQKHLTDGKLDFIALDKATQELLSAQIGSREKAESFFAEFKFKHSLQGIEDLEASLQDRICRNHTNEYGWLKLVRGVLKWSAFENSPSDGGKIQLADLKSLLEHKLAQTMPQEFSIPDGYLPPNSTFHKNILSLCTEPNQPTLNVIWGTPGRGKSTYLSYLKNELQKNGVHVIRHHFFLSLTDETVGRWLFHKVVSTLLHQLAREFPEINLPSSEGDLEGKLRITISDASKLAAENDKALVIILDGLDHVWRDSGGEVIALTTLFDELFPLPENVRILIGTQKVSDDQLPSRLLVEKPKSDWLEIPSLNFEPVFSWLKSQLEKAGHLAASCEDNCQKLANALLSKSSGHPLYLTYALAQLLAYSGEFDEEDVQTLPDCPDGDINKYYSRLWNSLEQKSKDILHLISASGFIWPDELSLAKCLTNEAIFLEAFQKVEHLFDRRPIGLKPFHGSILVYVSSQSEHTDKVRYVLPLMLSWLKESAPDTLRWGWEWLVESKLGNNQPLIEEPSRQWLINSIANGYSTEQAEMILSASEYHAFKGEQYARALEIRTIKTRFVNAGYQGSEYDLLLALALACGRRDFGLRQQLDDLSLLSENELLTASRLGLMTDSELPGACLDELNRRIELRIKYGVGAVGDEEIAPSVVAKIAALAPTAKIKSLFPFSAQHRDQPAIIEDYCQEAIRFGYGKNCQKLLSLLSKPKNSKFAKPPAQIRIAEYALRHELMDGLHLHDFNQYKPYLMSPFVACRFAVLGKLGTHPPSIKAIAVKDYDYQVDEAYFYDHFFSSLWVALASEGDFSFLPRTVASSAHAEAFHTVLAGLDQCALRIAEELEAGSKLDLVHLYQQVDEILIRPKDPSHKHSNVYIGFTNALARISLDLALMSGWIPDQHLLKKERLTSLTENNWWYWEKWADLMASFGLKCFEKDAVILVAEHAQEAITDDMYYISDLADGYCKIAFWLYQNDMHSECQEMIKKSLLYFTGYVHRKDITMHEVLEALDVCHDKGMDITHWLKRIEHIVLNILEFTDGKETHHCPRIYFDLLGKSIPDRLFTLYAVEQQKSEWHNCDHILIVLAEWADLTDPAVRALLETSPEPDIRFKLKERADAGEDTAAELYETMVKLWGEPRVAEKEDTSTPYHRVDPPIDVALYDPNNLEGFLKDLDAIDRKGLEEHYHYDETLAVIRWCEHWAEQGEFAEASKTLEEWMSDTSKRTYDIERALDTVTELAQRHLGRDEAFKWLCLSHRTNHGWNRYFSGGAEARVTKAATDFPQRWREFLDKTSEPKNEYWGSRYGLQIGTELLVRFFAELGDYTRAQETVEVMVSQVELDVAGLELNRVDWD